MYTLLKIVKVSTKKRGVWSQNYPHFVYVGFTRLIAYRIKLGAGHEQSMINHRLFAARSEYFSSVLRYNSVNWLLTENRGH